MRIFLLVFGILFAVGLLTGTYFLGKDIITERIALYRFTQDIAELKRLKVRGDRVTDCSQSNSDNHPNGYQLRFTSESEYVIESVCLYQTTEQLVIKKGNLYGGMLRVYGSGIHLGGNDEATGDTWVQLQYKGKNFYVGLFNQNPEVKTEMPNTAIGGNSPAKANCADWGFVCCSKSSGEGSGTQVPAIDCPNTCFQYCLNGPSVTFFNTSPPINGMNRTLNLSGKEVPVQFGYEIQDAKHAVDKVIINFGDGKQAQTSELKMDSVKHTYTCAKKHCVYDALISVSGSESLSSASTNNIRIVMTP